MNGKKAENRISGMLSRKRKGSKRSMRSLVKRILSVEQARQMLKAS